MTTTDTVLKILTRGVQMYVTDRLYAMIEGNCERNIELRDKIITILGKALGETLDTVEYPTYWRKFLNRKDCPKYMKDITKISVNAYYPKLSLPTEEAKIIIDTE